MRPDRWKESVQGLDRESRALLELSFVHRLGDEELASMLASDAVRVRERREGVLHSATRRAGAEPPPSR